MDLADVMVPHVSRPSMVRLYEAVVSLIAKDEGGTLQKKA
jgi:hypothetical protein